MDTRRVHPSRRHQKRPAITDTPAHHWTQLPTFVNDGPDTLTIPVDGAKDHPGVIAIACRLPALVAALRPAYAADGDDPLDDETVHDLIALFGLCHQVRLVLQGQEQRALRAAHRKGASLRTLATAAELNSPEGIRQRLLRTGEQAL